MPKEITQLLLAWNAGDDKALDVLTPLVYKELRRIAGRYMAAERTDHTLQASALVNEAYLKLIDAQHVRWQNRAHFFGISARLMRQILMGFARSNRYQKRGGGAQTLTLDEGLLAANDRAVDLVALDDALNTLAEGASADQPGCRTPVFRRAHPGRNRRGALGFFGHGPS